MTLMGAVSTAKGIANEFAPTRSTRARPESMKSNSHSLLSIEPPRFAVASNPVNARKPCSGPLKSPFQGGFPGQATYYQWKKAIHH
ncbi:hypothetical protein [Pseudomonas tohonis]|uniref:hypothetical protein n=1 Tax=Pseudomonas tohonis TaxID=2725477 RepID=UPI0015672B94|nr:hypothetical protein [Pseudomonas tohonis]